MFWDLRADWRNLALELNVTIGDCKVIILIISVYELNGRKTHVIYAFQMRINVQAAHLSSLVFRFLEGVYHSNLYIYIYNIILGH